MCQQDRRRGERSPVPAMCKNERKGHQPVFQYGILFQIDLQLQPVVLLGFMILSTSLLVPTAAQGQASDSTSGMGASHEDVSVDAGSPHDVESVMDVETVDAQRGQVYLEELTDLRARPLDLNRASWRDLARLPGINALIARRIVDHRRRVGGFASLSEITSVNGIHPAMYASLRPYLTISSPDTKTDGDEPTRGKSLEETPWADALQDIDIRYSQLWSRRLDVGAGYTRDSSRSHYIGGPGRYTMRGTVWLGNRLRAAGVFDKDPGEAWTWNPATRSYGFDHASGSLLIRGVGPLDRLVFGDYTVSLGQGVGIWSGLAFGKGRDPTGSVVRDRQGIRPFASTEENRFFRGVATDLQAGDYLVIGGFASRRALDARLTSDSSGTRGVASLPSSGLHRTESERETRDALTEEVLGGMIEMESRHVELGVGGLYATTSVPLHPGNRPYDVFDVAGQRLGVVTGHGTWFGERIRLAGELTRLLRFDATQETDEPVSLDAEASSSPQASTVLGDQKPIDGAWGGLIAVSYTDERRNEAVLVGRSYGKSFDNRFGAGFSETRPQNETGLYAGIRLGVAPRWTVSGYVDAYRSDWLRYQVYRPTVGREVRVLIEHEPRPWLSHYVQYRSETKEQDAAPLGGVEIGRPRPVAPDTRWSLRWNAVYRFSEQLRLRSRIEYVRASTSSNQQTTSADGVQRRSAPTDPSPAPKTGVLISQDVDWTPYPSLQISGRISHFDARAYEARVFAYERDVLYSFRVPALSGRGERSYVLVRWSLAAGFRVEAKYGVTRYADRDTVGSGLDAVEGNRIRELRLQIHWSL